MWPRFAAVLADDGDGASIGLRWGGKVSWESDSSKAGQLVNEVRQLQSWGYPTRLISADELSELEPSLSVGEVLAAEYSENEAQVEPQMVVDACLRRLAECEAVVHTDTEVTGFELGSDGLISAVKTTDRGHQMRRCCSGGRHGHLGDCSQSRRECSAIRKPGCGYTHDATTTFT